MRVDRKCPYLAIIRLFLQPDKFIITNRNTLYVCRFPGSFTKYYSTPSHLRQNYIKKGTTITVVGKSYLPEEDVPLLWP